MASRILLVCMAVAVAAVFGGCVSSPGESTPPKPEISPPVSAPGTQPPAAGMRVAPGLYELGQGRWQAVGVLEYRDVEGGTWVIVGGTEAEGNAGEVVAVVANPERFHLTLRQLRGELVVAEGRKLDGASIRMAGPELELATIGAVKDVGGAAE